MMRCLFNMEKYKNIKEYHKMAYMKIFNVKAGLNIKAGDKIWIFRGHYSAAIECVDFKEVFLTPIQTTVEEVCAFFDKEGEPYHVTAKLEYGKYWGFLENSFLTQEEAFNWIKTKKAEMKKAIETRKAEIDEEYQEKLKKINLTLNALDDEKL